MISKNKDFNVCSTFTNLQFRNVGLLDNKRTRIMKGRREFIKNKNSTGSEG